MSTNSNRVMRADCAHVAPHDWTRTVPLGRFKIENDATRQVVDSWASVNAKRQRLEKLKAADVRAKQKIQAQRQGEPHTQE